MFQNLYFPIQWNAFSVLLYEHWYLRTVGYFKIIHDSVNAAIAYIRADKIILGVCSSAASRHIYPHHSPFYISDILFCGISKWNFYLLPQVTSNLISQWQTNNRRAIIESPNTCGIEHQARNGLLTSAPRPYASVTWNQTKIPLIKSSLNEPGHLTHPMKQSQNPHHENLCSKTGSGTGPVYRKIFQPINW